MKNNKPSFFVIRHSGRFLNAVLSSGYVWTTDKNKAQKFKSRAKVEKLFDKLCNQLSYEDSLNLEIVTNFGLKDFYFVWFLIFG